MATGSMDFRISFQSRLSSDCQHCGTADTNYFLSLRVIGVPIFLKVCHHPGGFFILLSSYCIFHMESRGKVDLIGSETCLLATSFEPATFQTRSSSVPSTLKDLASFHGSTWSSGHWPVLWRTALQQSPALSLIFGVSPIHKSP